MLFHEIYGAYYSAAAAILREAVRGTLTGKKLNALVQEHAFGESLLTIPRGLMGEQWRLLHRDCSTPLEAEPSMPLTLLEKRWMKALLLDPRIQLFHPNPGGLEGIQPLFTPEMLVYYDRFCDGDNYQDPDYIRRFDTILTALRENRSLSLSFESRRGAQLRLVLTPLYLEYSEKNDRFRLIAADRKRSWSINLSSIRECALSDRSEPMPLRQTASGTVVFELEDRRNALERVLLHFSHLEKETKRLDETHYRVTLRYDRQDETEMVIRILSFGPVIRVTEPDDFIRLLRERMEKQFAICFPDPQGKAQAAALLQSQAPSRSAGDCSC